MAQDFYEFVRYLMRKAVELGYCVGYLDAEPVPLSYEDQLRFWKRSNSTIQDVPWWIKNRVEHFVDIELLKTIWGEYIRSCGVKRPDIEECFELLLPSDLEYVVEKNQTKENAAAFCDALIEVLDKNLTQAGSVDADVIRIKEAGRLLGITERAARERARKGDLVRVKPGWVTRSSVIRAVKRKELAENGET